MRDIFGKIFGPAYPALFVLSAILSLAAPRAAAQETGAVTVRVSDYDTEEFVFQADVQVMTFGRGTYSHRGFTDGGGRTTFPAVGRGNYIIQASHPDYETTREDVDVVPGLTASVFIRMKRKPERPKPAPAGLVAASSLAVPEDARAAYEEGMRLVRKEPAQSIVHFRRAVELYPKYSEAYALMGMAYMKEKNNEEGRKALDKAIEINPSAAFPLVLRGKMSIDERRFGDAEADLAKAVNVEPQAWDGHFELARCYFNTGKIEKALEHARAAHNLPQAPTSTHLLLFDVYNKLNDLPAAIKELEEFLKADPKSPLAPRVQQRLDELKKKNGK